MQLLYSSPATLHRLVSLRRQALGSSYQPAPLPSQTVFRPDPRFACNCSNRRKKSSLEQLSHCNPEKPGLRMHMRTLALRISQRETRARHSQTRRSHNTAKANSQKKKKIIFRIYDTLLEVILLQLGHSARSQPNTLRLISTSITPCLLFSLHWQPALPSTNLFPPRCFSKPVSSDFLKIQFRLFPSSSQATHLFSTQPAAHLHLGVLSTLCFSFRLGFPSTF